MNDREDAPKLPDQELFVSVLVKRLKLKDSKAIRQEIRQTMTLYARSVLTAASDMAFYSVGRHQAIDNIRGMRNTLPIISSAQGDVPLAGHKVNPYAR